MSADARLSANHDSHSSSSNGGAGDLENARLAMKSPEIGADGGEKVGDSVPPPQAPKEEMADPDVVDWDGPDDPSNPKNWSSYKKWANIYVLAAITFFSPLISSMFAPGVPQVQDEFHSSDQTLATFVVSVFLLGYVAGPLVLVPLADIYGRVAVYHVGNLGFIVFNVACALSTNMNMLIGFRFVAGIIGSAPMTVGGGTIADIMPPEQRGLAIMVWNLPVVAGPIIGPVIGGFLTQAAGWRWLFWLVVISSGVAAIAGVVVLRETNPVVILKWKTNRLRKETGKQHLRSKLDLGLSTKDIFVRATVRPFKLLFLSPICGLACCKCHVSPFYLFRRLANLFMIPVYNAFVYAIMYLFFTTFTFVFEGVYGFSQGTVGLTYIGMGIGMLGGMFSYGMTSDKIMKYLAHKHGLERPKPEHRLPLTIFAAPFIPIGLFIYGWTVEYHVHWAVPLLGTLLVGFGLTIILASVANYMIDTFTIYAGAAMAAITVSRSVFAATFPLFALHMYDALGWGWGNSLLGFIALAGCSIPPLFYIYGERLRTEPKYQVIL